MAAPAEEDKWEAHTYTTTVAPFVAQLTSKIVEWLDPQPTDRILDLGCGDGVLTARLAPHVASILGLDASPNMIAALHTTYPSVPARVLDARHLRSAIPSSIPRASFTKVFSNAALHWILRDASARRDVIRGCFEALAPGGAFVAECGGLGNVAEVHAALTAAVVHRGVVVEEARQACPWWFASVEAMRMLLEGEGFVWVKGEMELRPTVLTTEEGGGLSGWVKLFGSHFLDLLPAAQREGAVDEVCRVLEHIGRREEDGAFVINYHRLRFVARKPAE